jgi:hypothetical protein
VKEHDDIKALASGVKFAVDSMYPGAGVEFMLILVVPKGEGEVTINTITAITEPRQVEQIGQHLADMARAQAAAAGHLFDDDSTVEGHA